MSETENEPQEYDPYDAYDNDDYGIAARSEACSQPWITPELLEQKLRVFFGRFKRLDGETQDFDDDQMREIAKMYSSGNMKEQLFTALKESWGHSFDEIGGSDSSTCASTSASTTKHRHPLQPMD